MRKNEYKIYLSTEDYDKIRGKSNEAGFEGRGCVSHFIEHIAKVDIVFLDRNLKKVLKLRD